MLNYDDFDAILFDMDGTIFDSETVHREAWKITAKQFSQVFTDEMYIQFIGLTTPESMKLAMEMFNNSDEAAESSKKVDITLFSSCYYENLKLLVQQAVPLKKGFLDYLAKVKQLNKPLGIVTSSASTGVKSNFYSYDFYPAFTLVVTRDDVKKYKPDPAPYLLACERLGVKPERVIVFEDSNAGATAALAAGCYTIGIPDLVAFNDETSKRLHREIKSFEVLL
ncbi:HAD family phosphatase [Colwellia sp. E2M01]|uniref:HAD family hydrolase n=1 Tax=Colwellia sp. E2M01 TaxID=2841561 RepID=UPI001C096A0D|nr:HAD family phosphatase [Colwellia sp. E2M01]MBU2869335.1 HAD family phosphatase [Colwellia sp. E2M01]